MERKNLSNTFKDPRISVTATSNSNNRSSFTNPESINIINYNNNNISSFTNPESISVINNNIINNNNKLKYPWSYRNKSYGEDYLRGFSWPPRSYTCSFCKREFRSAQALGGHMNVHRRDRAKLRLSPPPRDDYNSHCHLLNLNPNPNPNPSSSVTSPVVSALCTTVQFNGSSNSKTMDFDSMRNFKTRKLLFDSSQEVDNGRKLMKKGEVLRLDLEIGVSSNPKEDLDLELRLGYS